MASEEFHSIRKKHFHSLRITRTKLCLHENNLAQYIVKNVYKYFEYVYKNHFSGRELHAREVFSSISIIAQT